MNWFKSIGFGLERVGLLSLSWPRATGAVMLLLIAAALFGFTRLTFDENLRGTFASDTQEYAEYVAATDDFVDPENESLVLVEGDLGTPETFQKLGDFQFELQLLDGVGNVYSLFALRGRPDANGDAPVLVSDPAAGLTPALAERIRAHPMLGGKLLSADNKAMLFVVTPTEAKAPLSVGRALKAEIDKLAAQVLAGTGLKVTVTGFPTIRAGIVRLLRRDQIMLNGAGAVVGFAMSLVAFRSVIAAFLTAMPGVLSATMLLGLMSLFGLPVTVLSNVLPALVMILGYADGMHLSYTWKRYRAQGLSPAEAEMKAQREVGAACVLTALLVAGAFLSLAITNITLVRQFALAGAVAMPLSALAVLTNHGLAAQILGRYWNVEGAAKGNLLTALSGPCAALAGFVVRFARPVAVVSAVTFVVFGAMYAAVPPQHSVREHLPPNDPANEALGRIDQELGGAFAVEILVPIGDAAPTSPQALAKIGDVQRSVSAVEGTATPLSLWSLVDWLGGKADEATAARLTALLDQADPATRSRLYNAQTKTALVSVNIKEASTAQTEALIDKIQAAADAAAGMHLVVTGVSVLTTREAGRTISTLNFSLATGVVADILLMMLAFRSIPMGLVSILGNTLPLATTGALLFVLGQGLQITSVVALTVAFGIAVNDTVHYLNHFAVLTNPRHRLADRIVESSRDVGPVLLGTTLIILTGLSITLTSGLPTVMLLGTIVALTLVSASVGDLVVLPALIMSIGRRWFGSEPRPDPSAAATADGGTL